MTTRRSRATPRWWPALRRWTTAATVAAGLVAAVAPPASAVTPDTWSTGLGDAGNSTTNPGETVLTAATAPHLARAWTVDAAGSAGSGPAVADGVAYRVLLPDTGNVTQPSVLSALSARTGEEQWSLPLVGDALFGPGVTVTGRYAVLSYNGVGRDDGVLVVDLLTRRVLWDRPLPPSTLAWLDPTVTPAYTDGERVFVHGSSYAVAAYRLTDGALLWTVPLSPGPTGAPAGVAGIAVGGGLVYTGGDEGVVAYGAGDGQRRWSAPLATGQPVLAGGRVLASQGPVVSAVPAAGCGEPTCPATWRTELPGSPAWATVGAADASSLFAVYGAAATAVEDASGVVVRLSAETGAVEWRAYTVSSAEGVVRAGDTIWLFDARVPTGQFAGGRILGYSATATGQAPLREIALPAAEYGFPMSLAVADGTLFHETRDALVGYRVPGT